MENSKCETEIDIFDEPKNSVTKEVEQDSKSYRINTQSMPLGSRSVGSSVVVNNSNHKVDSIKTWGLSTLKCTKQIIQEKMGKASKTVDLELEVRIDKLREIQRKYKALLETIKKLLTNFQSFVENQRLLSEQLSGLGQQQPELVTEFERNSELQRRLVKEGDKMIQSITKLIETLETMINKTMSDTLVTIKKYETSRVEYDAYRHELEEINRLSKSTDPNAQTKLMELKQTMIDKQQLYNQLRSDVDIKIKFLEENKNRVLHHQLVLFNQCCISYFTGGVCDGATAANIENNLSKFRLSLKNSNSNQPSWLEASNTTNHQES